MRWPTLRKAGTALLLLGVLHLGRDYARHTKQQRPQPAVPPQPSLSSARAADDGPTAAVIFEFEPAQRAAAPADTGGAADHPAIERLEEDKQTTANSIVEAEPGMANGAVTMMISPRSPPDGMDFVPVQAVGAVVGEVPEDHYLSTARWGRSVSCGGSRRRAATCAACGVGSARSRGPEEWCQGDCVWSSSNGSCVAIAGGESGGPAHSPWAVRGRAGAPLSQQQEAEYACVQRVHWHVYDGESDSSQSTTIQFKHEAAQIRKQLQKACCLGSLLHGVDIYAIEMPHGNRKKHVAKQW
jgi:hypothetical protein